MCCWVQISLGIFCSLGSDTGFCRNPFAKMSFSWFLIAILAMPQNGAQKKPGRNTQSNKSLATPVGTERSQIAQIAPKWLGESAKGRLGLRCGSGEKVSRTGASLVRTGPNLFRTSARDFFCTSAPEPQTTFRTLP